MKQYTYYPGCSCAEGTEKAYSKSALSVARVLDIELKELEDWNCCGSSPYSAYNELGLLSLASRNLALAEKTELDLVTPCSSCYVILSQTNLTLKKYPEMKAKVDEALGAAGLKYNGSIRVRHLLDVMVNDVGYDAITAKVTKELNGLKVAAYYGCQVVRPRPSFDDPENPVTMDKLIISLKAEVANFAMKVACCGSSLVLSEEAVALGMIKRILENAVSGGAHCIITPCPLCQMNLDAYQPVVNKKFGTDYHIPVLFFTQLMGLAFGLSEKDLDIKTGIVTAEKALARYR